MRKILMIALILSTVIFSCKKDKASDPRDRFVGTWKGNYTLDIQGLPPGFPNVLPTSIVISKSQSSSNEIEIRINNTLIQNQVANAVISGNQYIYKPLTLATLTLNGAGEISSDGKSISEEGTASGSLFEIPVSGTWTSALTKQ
jgi:hypothetical protein